MFTLTLLIVVLIVTFIYFKKKLSYWQVRGVPNTKPITPLGDLINCILKKKNLFHLIRDYYVDFKRKGCKFMGFYFNTGPLLIPIDKELIKRIMISDCDYFYDRGMYYDRKGMYLSDLSAGAKGERWKYLRDMINSITSPSKVNNAVPIAEIYADKLIKIVDGKLQQSIEVKDLFLDYVIDFASNFYVGIEENCLDKEVELKKYFHKISEQSWIDLIRIAFKFGLTNPGNLLLGLFTGKGLEEFFRNYVARVYELRKEIKINRGDALDCFIDRYENDENFDFQSFVGQILILYFATFDNTSLTATYALYEVGRSKFYQEKLRKEILETMQKSGNKLDANTISEMKSLDNFVTEVLRYHLLSPCVFRRCTKDYQVPDSNLVIENGTKIMVPLEAMQFDEEWFPKAEEFDPERYTNGDENINNAKNMVAFSMGPKRCPGKKLAFTVLKVILIKLLSNYRVSIDVDKTGDKLEKDAFTKQFVATYKNQVWIKFDKL